MLKLKNLTNNFGNHKRVFVFNFVIYFISTTPWFFDPNFADKSADITLVRAVTKPDNGTFFILINLVNLNTIPKTISKKQRFVVRENFKPSLNAYPILKPYSSLLKRGQTG